MITKHHNKSHSLFDDVKQLFPCGTRGEFNGNAPTTISSYWELYPRWPLDIFAASAYVLDKFDGYTILVRKLFDQKSLIDNKRTIHESAKIVGKSWREINDTSSLKIWNEKYDNDMQNLWDKFIKISQHIYIEDSTNDVDLDILKIVCIELLMISDEASYKVGYAGLVENWIQLLFSFFQCDYDDSSEFDFHDLFLKQTDDDWILKSISTVTDLLKREVVKFSSTKSRSTSCLLVSPKAACVHPKSKVPNVGCTLRAMSRNLAFLPPETKVSVSWNQHLNSKKDDPNFNILAIPFPFNIEGKSFQPSNTDDDTIDNHLFSVNQTWLHEVDNKAEDDFPNMGLDPHPKTTASVVRLVKKLLDEARKHVEKIDLIIFPELALDDIIYDALIEFLVHDNLKSSDDIFSIFISGVHHREPNNEEYNCALTTLITSDHENKSDSARTKIQYKHHRWLIDESQIRQYSISDSLNPTKSWWEDTPIENRKVGFMTFREGACFTTLICEDLARIDPCHHVVRSIGPNIVFALLMDGPQMVGRWPERYVMGLSDDPGSSVLTLTSLGLVTRSNYLLGSDKRSVGLWRDSLNGTRELILPKDHQGLLITTNRIYKDTYTLPGIKHNGIAGDQIWAFGGVNPLKVDHDEIST